MIFKTFLLKKIRKHVYIVIIKHSPSSSPSSLALRPWVGLGCGDFPPRASSEAWKTLKSIRTDWIENCNRNMAYWNDYYQNLFTENHPEFLTENDDDENNILNTNSTEDDLITPL